MKTTELQRDKDKFINWLSKEKGIGNKTSKDHYYRCIRVEKKIFNDINSLLSDESGFIKLIELIHKYGVKNSETKEQSYILVGTLRAAIKKYGEYKYPSMIGFYNKRYLCNYSQ